MQKLSTRSLNDKKAFEHAQHRARRNEALAKLNEGLNAIFGKQKRTLIQSLNTASEYVSSS